MKKIVRPLTICEWRVLTVLSRKVHWFGVTFTMYSILTLQDHNGSILNYFPFHLVFTFVLFFNIWYVGIVWIKSYARNIKYPIMYNKQKTQWKVLCTVFIHSLFRIIKRFYDNFTTREWKPYARSSHAVISIFLCEVLEPARAGCRRAGLWKHRIAVRPSLALCSHPMSRARHTDSRTQQGWGNLAHSPTAKGITELTLTLPRVP